jgi:hypothetical protein
MKSINPSPHNFLDVHFIGLNYEIEACVSIILDCHREVRRDVIKAVLPLLK